MASEVVIYLIPGHPRSLSVCTAMAEGIRSDGVTVVVKNALHYRQPDAKVAIFYGLAGKLTQVMKDYSAAERRRAVYVDLGYWGRKDGGRFAGYHKLSVDARHPTAYFQSRRHSPCRLARFGVQLAPWRGKEGKIVIAGMGPKGARAEGFTPTQWEREVVEAIRRQTDRPILYRPKPNWSGARPIEGTEFQAPDSVTLDETLRDAYALVSHHSNAAVEALCAGVPIFTTAGVALPLGLSDVARIEKPLRPDGREQWLADIAWTQWSVAEMREGLAWRYLKEEGLV